MKLLGGIFFGLLLITGCSKETAIEPEPINSEIDVCEICNMSIAEERYATEIITKDNDVYKFDDLGCLVEFEEKGKLVTSDEIEKRFVRDVETGEWIELEKAYYMYDSEFWTPMANGVLSFQSKERAEAYINEQGAGALIDYDELFSHEWGWKLE